MERAEPPCVHKTAFLTAARWAFKCTVGQPEEVKMAATVHLTLVAPDNEKCPVQSAPARLPRRKPNVEYRSREHLTEREVERLIEAMKGNRWGHRDATMVLMAFRHGLRASELVDPCWAWLSGDGRARW